MPKRVAVLVLALLQLLLSQFFLVRKKIITVQFIIININETNNNNNSQPIGMMSMESIVNSNHSIDYLRRNNTMNSNDSNSNDNDDQSKNNNLKGVFDSIEFQSFLKSDIPEKALLNSSIFLSKDSVIPGIGSSSLFKSKESFSSLFASKDWEMKYTMDDINTTKHPSNKDEKHLKSFSDVDTTNQEPPALVPTDDVFKSKDWMSQSLLGDHVDVPINPTMFTSRSSSGSDMSDGFNMKSMDLPPAHSPSSFKTDWDDIFMRQLMPTDPSPAPEQQAQPEVDLQEESIPLEEEVNEAVEDQPKPSGTKKKRKRAPRKKIVPVNKLYVEPTDLDILGGRGGKSNHHPGNKRYRAEIENLKEWYIKIDDKDEKTDLSQCLVDFCQSYGARFLQFDGKGWYIIENIEARRKASQALREDSDPTKRKEKRDRFLAKRAKQQAAARKLKKAKP